MLIHSENMHERRHRDNAAADPQQSDQNADDQSQGYDQESMHNATFLLRTLLRFEPLITIFGDK
jgi:hypothetical protein